MISTSVVDARRAHPEDFPHRAEATIRCYADSSDAPNQPGFIRYPTAKMMITLLGKTLDSAVKEAKQTGRSLPAHAGRPATLAFLDDEPLQVLLRHRAVIAEVAQYARLTNIHLAMRIRAHDLAEIRCMGPWGRELAGQLRPHLDGYAVYGTW